VDAPFAVQGYAAGLFPMDGPEYAGGPLPWWVADPRTIFELDPASLAALRRRVRRSLRVGEGWELRRDTRFAEVVAACAAPRSAADGVWLTPRMQAMYSALFDAGVAHSYELWAGSRLAAGLLAVRLGRAAMLESMFHRVGHAGNVVVVRTLERLVGEGVELCDLQTATEHTLRLGAVQIRRAEYEDRLRAALSG
jgi:leucyl/phenylalanyl-tRNA--protein transferase